MRLYSHPLSPFAMKARLALFEKNLNFETVHVPWSRAKGFDKPSQMLAINPKGQVPTMVDDDIALYDSTIIFEYLEERYPEPHLYPTEQADRVACRLLEDYADHVIVSEIPRLRTEVFFKTNPAEKDQSVIASAEVAIRKAYGLLEKQLTSKPYLCGEFSVADIANFALALQSSFFGVAPDVTQPNLTQWISRMRERPSVQRDSAQIQKALGELSPAVT